MDKNFLEFWGNFLLNAAKGQQQVEAFYKLLGQDQPKEGFDELVASFARFYGFDIPNGRGSEKDMAWQKASEAFHRSMADFLALLDVVPRSEFRRLETKCKELESTVAAQTETIRRLRRSHDPSSTGQEEVLAGFQEILRRQSNQFRHMLDASRRYWEQAPEDGE